MYLHDLIYCFLNMINMMLSAYSMYFLFYVEVYEYIKWNYLFILYMYKCVFLMHINWLIAYMCIMWIIACIIIVKLTHQVFNLWKKGEDLFCRDS